MKRKIVSGLVLSTLLVSIFALTSSTQSVNTWENGTIYIRADGSVEPNTAPISSVDNVTYAFSENINGSIVAERDNIVLDGAGYKIQSPLAGYRRGISLWERSNVTIKNMEIKAFQYGILLHESSNNSLCGNNLADNFRGIELESFSSYNSVYGNNITESNVGILLEFSPKNNIWGNNIVDNVNGVDMYESSNNTIHHNNFVNNREQVWSYYLNIWDGGYPSGGNYWSDYTGSDDFWGEDQDFKGCDLIGDIQYVIDESNQDKYPLMRPWDEYKPSITEFPDLTGDGEVNIIDISIVAVHFGETLD